MNILSNFNLKSLHTFHTRVNAAYFSVFQSNDDLFECLSSKIFKENSSIILGGGSNLLFTKDFNGIVLKNELLGIQILKQNDTHVWIEAGAGENWHQLVLWTIQNGFAGLENLSLIPGCVGASPMQNIGAYGVEVKDYIDQVKAIEINSLKEVFFANEDCNFGYRESIFKSKFKNQFVITSVVFKLSKAPVFHIEYGAIKEELERMKVSELSLAAVSNAVIRIRSSKLPNPDVLGNAGSFFKNPTISTNQYKTLLNSYEKMPGFKVNEAYTKVPAAWLIEHCGWKGFRRDDAGVNHLQALVLVNYGNASGIEIYNLSEEILQSVKEKFGITLEREVNIY